MSDIASIISAIGFPCVAAIACGLFIKFQYTENQKQIDSMRKEHKEEVQSMVKAIENNTLTMQKLIDKLDNKKE